MPDKGETRNPVGSERLNLALKHVEMGFGAFSVWSTTPDGVCKCVKGRDCVSAGKHPIPRDGFNAASTDPKTVTAMMSAGSEPNYGLVWPLGDDVVFSWDIDGADWKAKMAALSEKYGPLPKTKTTKTPNGGLHLYYRWPQGVPIPEGNHLHGFIVRWPMKGYVVGPGSGINGRVYTSVGTEAIATLPVGWTDTGGHVSSPVSKPLITVTDDESYHLPESIGTGSRHDEIARFVASRWNRGLTKAEVAASVRAVLVPLFAEVMDEKRLTDEIDHAWDTCEKGGWEKTFGESTAPVVLGVETESGEEIVIDPLAIESRIERPSAMDFHDVPIPVGLALLLDHLHPLTDAPHSSLALASVVQLAALMGRKPMIKWNGDQRISIFGALIGDSNYGRKGAAIRETQRALRQVDAMLPLITEKGFGSGEAFVDLVAEAAKSTTGNGSVVVVEHEMASILTIAAREGNTLSYQLREAWDGDPLKTRARKAGVSFASNYHVCMLGATTPSELELRLNANDVANGWANRWLWFWSERRDGGYDRTRSDDVPLPTIEYLRDCIEIARTMHIPTLMGMPLVGSPTMTLTKQAEAYLNAKADALDAPAVGVIGVLRQRMPPIALRMGMVAALLDQSVVVEVEHLEFGFAMTDYAVESMRAVFGLRVDDEVAMHILGILAQVPDGWMNTTDLRKVTGKDHPRVRTAVTRLIAAGVVKREDRRARGAGGRDQVGYKMTIGKGA